MFRMFSVAAVAGAFCLVAWAQGLPGMAAGVVQQSNLARQSAAQHESASALDHIRQASTWTADILKASPAEPQPVLVELYQNVDTTTTYSPAKKSRTGEYAPENLKRDSAVQGAEAQVTTGSLDVTSAAAHLAAAENAVRREDWLTADAELAAIPNSVIRTTVEGNMPLLEARQNLRLARMRVLEDQFKDAVAPLRAAAQDLANYEKLSPGPRVADAEYMRQKIETYSHLIGHRPADAVAQIDAWLDPIEKWNQETLDHHSSGTAR